jgi:hypothetical protein
LPIAWWRVDSIGSGGFCEDLAAAVAAQKLKSHLARENASHELLYETCVNSHTSKLSKQFILLVNSFLCRHVGFSKLQRLAALRAQSSIGQHKQMILTACEDSGRKCGNPEPLLIEIERPS